MGMNPFGMLNWKFLVGAVLFVLSLIRVATLIGWALARAYA